MVCRRIRVFFSLILALAAVNVGADRCNDVPEVFVAMPKEIVEIWNENVGRSVIRVRMAVSARQRAAGFQNVCEAEIARFPLLFVFDRDVRTRFHMQNVQTALHIAFFSRSGSFISRQRMPRASVGQPGRLYGIESSYRYALEFSSDELQKLLSGPGKIRIVLRR
jgi:uncharacterized membrane protein (UPF0127 family)